MAENHSVNNIQFQWDNLLNLEHHGVYDMISCSGVLHHLNNPSEGLASLVKHLRPNGVINLALYRATARKTILEFRSLTDKIKLSVDEKLIREARQALLSQPIEANEDHLTLFSDFFTMSGCRDLMFNAQEHNLSFQELKDLTAPHELTFLKIDSSSINKAVLKGSEFENISDYDLEAWGRAEARFPSLFHVMYRVVYQYQPTSH